MKGSNEAGKRGPKPEHLAIPPEQARNVLDHLLGVGGAKPKRRASKRSAKPRKKASGK